MYTVFGPSRSVLKPFSIPLGLWCSTFIQWYDWLKRISTKDGDNWFYRSRFISHIRCSWGITMDCFSTIFLYTRQSWFESFGYMGQIYFVFYSFRKAKHKPCFQLGWAQRNVRSICSYLSVNRGVDCRLSRKTSNDIQFRFLLFPLRLMMLWSVIQLNICILSLQQPLKKSNKWEPKRKQWPEE